MKSERGSKHIIIVLIATMLLGIMASFKRVIPVTRKATLEEFPGGLLTAYCNDMTFLLGKKTLHPFIIVDIEKAKLSYDVTEKELMNSPYCYLGKFRK